MDDVKDGLEKVPGIGPATMKEIRNDITLTGATAAPAKAAGKFADKGKRDEPKAAARKTDEPKTAAKKETTKGGVKADEKAMKKAVEKKGAKKDDAKAVDTKDEKKDTKK